MTLKQWFDDPATQQLYAKLLEDPIMVQALALVAQVAQPKPERAPIGVDMVQWAALKGERFVGFAMCLRLLNDLARPRKDLKEANGWGTAELENPPQAKSSEEQ